MGKGKPSGALNVPQEKSDDDVESDTRSEEPCEELSEEPSEEHGDDQSEEPSQEPSIESFCQSPCSSENNDDSERQSKYVQADSSEKKRSLDISAGQVCVLQAPSQKMYKQERSIEPGSVTWPATTKSLNNTFSDGDASQRQEQSISGKRRPSRWEPQLGGDVKVIEADGTCKRRKTRWDGDDSQLKMPPIQLPEFEKNHVGLVALDPEIHDLNIQLLKINKKLRGARVFDDRPEEERSPSPPPEYNNLGIRINSREFRLRKKLNLERQDIISKLMNHTLKPPSDHKQTPKFSKKLDIPVKEYPSYNFIGIIIGPRGNTIKKMEKETGARIYVRGKDSLFLKKPGSKQGEIKREGLEYVDSDSYVLIEADSKNSLDAAVGMVEKLLVPVEEGLNEHKRAQLKELAELKLLRDGISRNCKRCGRPGHEQYVCPGRNSTLNVDVLCHVCGGDHPTTSCPSTASYSGNMMDSQFHSAISNIGHGSAVFGVSPIQSSSIQGKGNPALSGSLCFYGTSSSTGVNSTENVRAAPLNLESLGATAMKLLPPYLGPSAVAQDNPVLSDWPGPPGSMLPEPCATFPKNDLLGLPSVSSEESDRFSRQLPSYYGSDCSITSSPHAFAPFPGNRTYSTNYSRESDSINRQAPLTNGSSYKIPHSTTSILSQVPSNLSSSPSSLSYRSSYDIPVSSSSIPSNFSSNPRSSPGRLVQTDSFSRRVPSYWSSS